MLKNKVLYHKVKNIAIMNQILILPLVLQMKPIPTKINFINNCNKIKFVIKSQSNLNFKILTLLYTKLIIKQAKADKVKGKTQYPKMHTL